MGVLPPSGGTVPGVKCQEGDVPGKKTFKHVECELHSLFTSIEPFTYRTESTRGGVRRREWSNFIKGSGGVGLKVERVGDVRLLQ